VGHHPAFLFFFPVLALTSLLLSEHYKNEWPDIVPPQLATRPPQFAGKFASGGGG
jgi:hypothetical protein